MVNDGLSMMFARFFVYHWDIENILSVYVTKSMIFGYVGVPGKWLAELGAGKISLGFIGI